MLFFINEQIFTQIQEIMPTRHSLDRMETRLTDLGLPQEFVDKIDYQLYKLEDIDNYEYNAIFLAYIPEYKHLKPFVQRGDGYFYKREENGKRDFGNEVWAITKDNKVFTLLLQYNRTKDSLEIQKSRLGDPNFGDINIYLSVDDVPKRKPFNPNYNRQKYKK